jgi:hypothetical protein
MEANAGTAIRAATRELDRQRVFAMSRDHTDLCCERKVSPCSSRFDDGVVTSNGDARLGRASQKP